MTDTTPRMALQELVASQAQKHVTVNDDLIALDAMTCMYVKGNGTNTPPTSPSDGDTYIVGSSPTGDWAEKASKIAYCIDGGWRFYTPFNGLQTYDSTASAFIIYDGGDWSSDIVTATRTQTLSNKTLASPTLSGSMTLPGSGSLGTALTVTGGGSRIGASGVPATRDTLALLSDSPRLYFGVVDSEPNFKISAQDMQSASISISAGTENADPTASTYTEVFTVYSNGLVSPGADNTQNLGSASLRWATVYAGAGSINTSDATEKEWRGSLTDAEFAAGKAIFSEIGGFKFLNAVAKKGAGKARLHFGVRAQNVRDILTAHGLDPLTYAFLCYDEWSVTEDYAAGSRWGIRYAELTAFLLAVLDRRIAALEAK